MLKHIFTHNFQTHNYTLESICHFFAKRLNYGYEEVMTMPRQIRNRIFDMEMQVIDKEKQAYQSK